MPSSLDVELGRRIGSLLRQPTFQGRADSRFLSQVQDLLGSETTLLAPLRDMLSRPGFQSLIQVGAGSARMTGRDALIGDLQQTYSVAVTRRLEDVLNGILNLSVGPGEPSAQTAGSQNPQRANHRQTEPSPQPVSQSASPTVHTYTVQTAASPQGVLTGAVIAILSLLFGGGTVGLGWLLLSQSQAPKQIQAPERSGVEKPPTLPARPAREERPAEERGAPSDTSLWGPPEEYKFGQIPNSQYPQTCAFSLTDAQGEQTLADKSKLEFWACSDEGGSPSDGYTIIWGDGKRTVYKFNANGMGSVVGTNGQPVAIHWQNSNHNGQPIIVISHRDGATSWIPGNVGD